jgi:hypothetical protein
LEINTKWTSKDGFPHLSKVPSHLSESSSINLCVRCETLTVVDSVLRQSRRCHRRFQRRGRRHVHCSAGAIFQLRPQCWTSYRETQAGLHF